MRLMELWRAWQRRKQLPQEVRLTSTVLTDLVPRYHRTQEGAHHKQHKPLLRYPKRPA